MRRIGLTVCVLAGAIAAWNARHGLNPDGLSYLDLADALQRGHWSAALNAYWNPLYPALLAVFARPATIPPGWEFTSAHVLNFAIYLAALASFDALMREMFRSMPSDGAKRGLFLTGYATFLWATIGLIRLDVVTPDLLMTMALNLAFVFWLRTRPVAAGLMLGLGYLAKTVMLPVTVLLVLSMYVAFRLRGEAASARRAGVVRIGLGFLLLAAPFIVALSVDRGRFTVGDSGRLNYAWKVGGMTSYFFPAPGEATGLAHPPRMICASPPAYEFGGMAVTYPPWYDPAYWFDGVNTRFTWRGQMEVFRSAAVTMYVMLREASLLALFLALAGLNTWRTRQWQSVGPEVRTIALTCILSLAMYAMVEFSLRLTAPFIPPLVLAALLGLSTTIRRDRSAQFVTIGSALLFTAMIVQPVLARTVDELSLISKGTPVHDHLEIAKELTRAGIRPGDPVAVIGEGYGAYWARLARARIIAEVPDVDRFWSATPENRRECLDRFRTAGARAVVTFRARPAEDEAKASYHEGWQPLGATHYNILQLER